MSIKSLFARIFRIGKANAHATLDAIEDPQKMLDQSVRDYTNNIAEAESAVAQTIGNLRMQEDDHARMLREAHEWGGKAQAASDKADEFSAAGDEDSARKFNQLATVAIRKQMASEKAASDLEPTIHTQREVVKRLKAGLETMKTKRQELVAKRNELVNRARNAKTQGQMLEALKAVDFKDPTSEVNRFEQQVRQEEAKARGAAELASSSLDAQFAALEDLDRDAEIESRLAALKPSDQIVDEAPAPGQLDAQPAQMSEVEMRLAALKKHH